MLFIVITLALICQVNSDTLCDRCVCNYDNKDNGDFKGEYVDCSYVTSVLEMNYTLPTSIHSLDLSSNNISIIYPSILLRSDSMLHLHLNNNKITLISNNSLQLRQLERLDLSNNLLEYIDKNVFKNMRKLTYLNLANNRFTAFSKLAFHHLSNLEEIILDNNDIGPSLQDTNLFDRSGFGVTRKIKSLSISGIHLNEVPDNFFVDAYDIRKLVMSNNNLTDIFELPYTLEYLDLSENPIHEIEREDFNDLIILKVLKLNNIAIQEVPKSAFASLSSLTELELERNKNLTEFSALAFGKKIIYDPIEFTLESISLKGSRIKSLDKDLSRPFGQLAHLDLQGNPWVCDCRLVWVKDLQIPEKDYDHFRCASPKPFFNARVFDLDPKYFSCPPDRRHVGAIIGAVSLCLLLAGTALWLIICLPKYRNRSNCIRQMYTPSTAYSVLPLTVSIENDH